MDPNIITEESGVPEERQLGTATGTAYLRQLRKHAAESPVLPSETNAVIPAETVTDRRQSRRHQCTGSVRLRAEGSDVRLWGTLKDISLNGCYVETVTTFPVNTQVNVELESAGIRVLARSHRARLLSVARNGNVLFETCAHATIAGQGDTRGLGRKKSHP